MASRPIAMHEVCPFDVMSNGHFSLNSSNGNGNHCKYFRLPSSCVRLLACFFCLPFGCSSFRSSPRLTWQPFKKKKNRRRHKMASFCDLYANHIGAFYSNEVCGQLQHQNTHKLPPSRAPLSSDSRQRLAKAKV